MTHVAPFRPQRDEHSEGWRGAAHLVLGGCRRELTLQGANASSGGVQRRLELLLACFEGGSEVGVLDLLAGATYKSCIS